jgi:hypothetical protein
MISSDNIFYVIYILYCIKKLKLPQVLTETAKELHPEERLCKQHPGKEHPEKQYLWKPFQTAPCKQHQAQSTYIEYRAVSGVFRTIDPPSPHPSPCTKGRGGGGGRGVHTRRVVRGQYFGRRRTLDWFLQYNPSTAPRNIQEKTPLLLERVSVESIMEII